jgi:hypothetical protein
MRRRNKANRNHSVEYFFYGLQLVVRMNEIAVILLGRFAANRGSGRAALVFAAIELVPEKLKQVGKGH